MITELPPPPGTIAPPTSVPAGAPVINVLLVEDSATDALLIEESLATFPLANFHVRHVERCADAIALLADGTFHILLTDLGLPDTQGVETLQALRAAAGNIPLIVLTGNSDERLGLDALRLGAHDYLVKSQVSGNTVGRAIRYCVEREALEQQIRHTSKLEAVGQLAGGVAHDFNNLLTVIQGNASLVLDDPAATTVIREAATEITAASNRAANLTRQLLAFSRRQPMRREPVDLDATVGEMMRMLKRLLGERVEIRVDLQSRALVFADRSMVEQVLMNLVVNARDAMARGGVLTVRTGRPADAALRDRFVELSVADTGCGIKNNDLPHIFEPFFTTKEFGQGTGLGLATVYGIVNQHDGTIRVETAEGKGTTFYVLWPLACDKQGGETAKSAAQALPRGNGELILVAEDEPALRQMLKLALSRNGYSVIAAENGDAALTQWRAHRGRLALIMTDVVMPGHTSGTDLIRELRRANDPTPILLTSGYSPDLLRAEGVLGRNDQLLSKPFTPLALLETVASMVKH